MPVCAHGQVDHVPAVERHIAAQRVELAAKPRPFLDVPRVGVDRQDVEQLGTLALHDHHGWRMFRYEQMQARRVLLWGHG